MCYSERPMLFALGCIPPLIIFYGFWLRYKAQPHVRVMITAIVVDLLVIGFIEFRRRVVERASHGGLDPLLKFHISLAMLSIVMYVIATWTGWKIWKGTGGRRVHRANGVLLLGVRSLVSITSAMVAFR